MSRPRIAYLLKKFPRLSETFVLNEILRQEDRGTSIRVFSRREADDEPRHPQLADLKAEIEPIPPARGIAPWIALFEYAEGSSAVFQEFGRFVRKLAVHDHPRMHSLIAEALYLQRRTSELEIDHVHLHFATDAAITAMILQELGGPSYSITAHAKDIYRSTVDPELLSLVVARSSFTVTVCDANVRHLEGLLDEAAIAKVRRLYNGIPLDEFAFSPEGRDEDHVLAVGRLVPKKGFDVLIDSLAQLAEHRPALRATIIGEGDEREALEARIAEHGLSSRVQLLGGLDQQAVREWMQRATVMCLPCVIGEDGNRDALPTVLLEALAVGLPCISTPVTGIPEILADGDAGVIVPEHDVIATTSALAALLDDVDRRASLATIGRARAEELFDGCKSAEVLGGWFMESCGQESCA